MPSFCRKVLRVLLQCQPILKFVTKKVHLEGRLAPNWPPDFCHLGAETCAAPWCPCPHGSLLIGGGMPAVPLSGLPGSAVPTEEAPGLSCRHPEPETKRLQKSMTMCRIEIHGCVFVCSPSGDHPFIGRQAGTVLLWKENI